MIRTLPYRTAAVLAVALAVAALPLTTAPTAHADDRACEQYLHSKKYQIGPRVNQACRTAYDRGKGPNREAICKEMLLKIEVKPSHAASACRLGVKP
ncbi:hypothetical protein AB0I49_37835 [Streptomyces sp. NPDC050617]|uniref:hypothetical protein n=1 Tax=Streptomyces sp. NPDC050617 TaxID=3154628 RepID=UPI0034135C82